MKIHGRKLWVIISVYSHIVSYFSHKNHDIEAYAIYKSSVNIHICNSCFFRRSDIKDEFQRLQFNESTIYMLIVVYMRTSDSFRGVRIWQLFFFNYLLVVNNVINVHCMVLLTSYVSFITLPYISRWLLAVIGIFYLS